MRRRLAPALLTLTVVLTGCGAGGKTAEVDVQAVAQQAAADREAAETAAAMAAADRAAAELLAKDAADAKAAEVRAAAEKAAVAKAVADKAAAVRKAAEREAAVEKAAAARVAARSSARNTSEQKTDGLGGYTKADYEERLRDIPDWIAKTRDSMSRGYTMSVGTELCALGNRFDEVGRLPTPPSMDAAYWSASNGTLADFSRQACDEWRAGETLDASARFEVIIDNSNKLIIKANKALGLDVARS